jgi:hypothetical protein
MPIDEQREDDAFSRDKARLLPPHVTPWSILRRHTTVESYLEAEAHPTHSVPESAMSRTAMRLLSR